jgi:hypothetical protein
LWCKNHENQSDGKASGKLSILATSVAGMWSTNSLGAKGRRGESCVGLFYFLNTLSLGTKGSCEQLQNERQFRNAKETTFLGFSPPNRFKVPLSVAESLVPIGINSFTEPVFNKIRLKIPS